MTGDVGDPEKAGLLFQADRPSGRSGDEGLGEHSGALTAIV
jgi:hypothetical protein